jgi:lactate racemase
MVDVLGGYSPVRPAHVHGRTALSALVAADRRDLISITPMLGTAAWYGDRDLQLEVPRAWDVVVDWPTTPAPIGGVGVRAGLARPIGQPRLRELAAGRRRVCIVVDDLTRPTPVPEILPHVVAELAAAGLEDSAISIVIGSGTHGPAKAGFERKLGTETVDRFRVLQHDDGRDCVRVGTTSFGSPVEANRAVVQSDLVIGIGGIYPQHTVGFGGGAKIVLGILGRRSIERLHYRHASVGGRSDLESDFRRDIAEMARLVGLEVSINALVDARRRLVWLGAGDPERCFVEGRHLAASWFAAPLPGGADVVIANAYPMDLSATFVRSKGVVPLTYAAPHATRILIGAASEGLGHHGLFPLENDRRERMRQVARWARNARRTEVARLVTRRLVSVAPRALRRRRPQAGPARPPIIFHPTSGGQGFPSTLGGMQVIPDWGDIIALAEDRHLNLGRGASPDAPIRAVVYPCSSLQVLA